MLRWTLVMMTAATLVCSAGACKKDGDGGGEAAKASEKKEEKAGMYAGFDKAADLKALQGTWSVKHQFGQPRAVWTIAGEKLTWKDEEGTRETTIELEVPGRLGVKKEDATYNFDYAITPDGVYIGQGGGGRKVGDTWWITDMHGVLTYDGKACQWFAQRMGDYRKPFEDPTPAQCSVADQDGAQVFSYQTPKFMKEGEFEDHTRFVVGDWMLSEQLRDDHKVEKAE